MPGDCVIVDRPLAESYTVDSSAAKFGLNPRDSAADF